MKRVYTIRLYQKHDMDLLSLRLRGVDLADAVHQSLAAFIEGRNMILLPPHTKYSDFMENNVETKVEKKLVLDDEDSMDVQIIDMLDRMNEGSWNNFFKNLLRMYLWHPYAENYVKSAEDLKFFEERASVYKQNKEIGATRKEVRRKSKSKNNTVKKAKKRKDKISKEEPVKKTTSPIYDNIIDLDEWDEPEKTTRTITPDWNTLTTAPVISDKQKELTSTGIKTPEVSPDETPIPEPSLPASTEESQQVTYGLNNSDDGDLDDITKAFSELLI